MRAAVFDIDGPDRGRLRLVDLPVPEPGPGEVRVRVHVSGVNPTDVNARSAAKERAWTQQVAHQDGAGVIDAVGANVDLERIGQRVWVYFAAAGRPSGTAAEYVCLPERLVVPLPDHVSFAHGAGIGIPALTAQRCVASDPALGGLTVLVTGGAGAVGNAAIQLARRAGARVITTVSSEEKARLAEAAGAHKVLYYPRGSFGQDLSEATPDGIDHVVDVAPGGNLPTYEGALAPRAQIVVYARDRDMIEIPVRPFLRGNRTLRFVHIFGVGWPALIDAAHEVSLALDAGQLDPLPFHRFPLERIPDAHKAVAGGVTGKVVVDIVEDHQT